MDQLSQGITIAVIATFFLLIVGVGIVSLILLQQKRQMETRLQTQEEVLKRISQEIHDNIGQVLTLAKLNLTTFNLENRQETETKLNDTRNLLGNCLHDLRSLSRLLHTDVIVSQGLLKSVEDEIHNLRKSVTHTVALQIEGDPYHLPAQQELRLFRIFQEVITNIIKHAGATIIEIQMIYSAQAFTLQIRDNGRGFSTTDFLENQPYSSGIGLRNMKDRASQIGASLTLDSSPGRGTVVTVRLFPSRPKTKR